jgi:DNA polymerase-3 subunit beta
MKQFKAQVKELLKAVTTVAAAKSSNPVLPILEDILFEVDTESVKVSATDLEISIVATAKCVSNDKFKICIPTDIFVSTLKMLPEQEITINVNETTFQVEIVSGKNKYKLAGENGEDFPNLPEVESERLFSINGKNFQSLTRKNIVACSNDDLRPAMTGILFNLKENVLETVSTDAHKLVRIFSDVSSNQNGTFILPKKGLNIASKLVADNYQVRFNPSNVVITTEDVSIYLRIIDYPYPNYNAIIPISNPYLAVINRNELLSSIRRVSLFSNKITHTIVFNFKENMLTISGQDLDFSNEANESIAIQYKGEEMTIAFNGKFLSDLLPTIDTEDVMIEFSTPTKAAILSPLEEVSHDILLMPVMLSN